MYVEENERSAEIFRGKPPKSNDKCPNPNVKSNPNDSITNSDVLFGHWDLDIDLAFELGHLSFIALSLGNVLLT
jgi:hypothetical protein